MKRVRKRLAAAVLAAASLTVGGRSRAGKTWSNTDEALSERWRQLARPPFPSWRPREGPSENTDIPAFLSLRPFGPAPHQKASDACEAIMPLQSEPDPDFDARWAAWLTRGAAHDRAVRRRLVVLVPVAIVV